jgi:pyridoxal phosphate enzyme (YggS family)
MIKENVRKIRDELPPEVEIVAAAKTRTPEEIMEAVEAGIHIIGQNYVQEALETFQVVGRKARWHFIGHLQRNKVKKAVEIFDMIETVDSPSLAQEIDKRCDRIGKIMPVLIEINSGKEKQKSGVSPEDTEGLIKEISVLKNIEVQGLMTMGPFFGDPENARPYFVVTKNVFDQINALDIPGIEMKYLSMGMTNSYKVAVEEGANIVRIGTKIFGERQY